MSLIFYDLETSGTTKGFDQILQFAALRTDDDLEQVGDSYEVRSRLLTHVIPAPRALQVTRMTIEQVLDPGRLSQAPTSTYDGSFSRSHLRLRCGATGEGPQSASGGLKGCRRSLYVLERGV